MWPIPDAPEPEACPGIPQRHEGESIHAHIELRLAIIADYMPSVVGNALGRIMHCTSLDNTIRFGRLEPTEWVLCDNRMEYAGNGFGHGSVHLWSRAGTLLATASQSMIIRAP